MIKHIFVFKFLQFVDSNHWYLLKLSYLKLYKNIYIGLMQKFRFISKEGVNY